MSGDQSEPSTLYGAYPHPILTHVDCPVHHSSSFDSGSNINGANVQTLAMILSPCDKFVYQGQKPLIKLHREE